MKAAQEAIIRIIGKEEAEKFSVKKNVELKGCFKLRSEEGKIVIEGDCGVSLLSGFYWYLKYYLNCQISWGQRRMDIPEVLPEIEEVERWSPYEYRYYLNYCTHSYSMAFWDWERWEQEIDFMALNGINLALNLVGAEEVYRRFLLKCGYSDEAARDYICGPAYFAWFFMGNMSSFGGTLPFTWFQDRLLLSKKINERMKELGIQPVIPGYGGMVPDDFKQKEVESKLIDQGTWNGFRRPAVLEASCQVFEKAGKIFYQVQKEAMGMCAEFYAVDPFHEGGNVGIKQLEKFGEKIQSEMLRANPSAIWVIQAWGDNPQKALLDSVDKDKMLILNLLGGRQRLWEVTEGFYGTPWLWCTIQNYGRRIGMYGFLNVLARESLEAKNSNYGKNMKGIGWAPEAIETNPVSYELGMEMSWNREPVDVELWLKQYVKRRYGKITPKTERAWKLLKESVYHSFVRQPGGVESVICARPKPYIQNVSSWGPKAIDYDTEYVLEALNLLYESYDELADSEGYRYDLTDVARQVMSAYSRVLHERLMYYYNQNDLPGLKRAGKRFLNLLDLQEELLSNHKDFMLSGWTSQAISLGRRYGLEEMFLQNAKMMISTWGDKVASLTLHDYACKEWAGITGSLYRKRWTLFLEALERDLEEGQQMKSEGDFDWSEGERERAESYAEKIKWEDVDYEWAMDSESYIAVEKGELKEAVGKLIHFVL